MRDDEKEDIQQQQSSEVTKAESGLASKVKEAEGQIESALQMIKASVREDDPKPSPSLTLGKIIGGDLLNAAFVRRQLWLIVLVVVFTVVYVAFRYQCQQDMIAIDKLENELKDAKYKALSSSSALTERCRESHVLELLKNNKDSLLHIADQPPYIISVPEE